MHEKGKQLQANTAKSLRPEGESKRRTGNW